jgi:FkbH-like protein
VTQLHWLVDPPHDWRDAVKALRNRPTWDSAVALANCQLNFVLTQMLDSAVQDSTFEDAPPAIRLAVLGSATTTHLLPAIRIGCLRRGLKVELYECAYGQYFQELADPSSGLHAFKPAFILLALDSYHMADGFHVGQDVNTWTHAVERMCDHVTQLWKMAPCAVLHQLPLPLHLPLLGANEHRLLGSRNRFIADLTNSLRLISDQHGVDVLALDQHVAQDGLSAWHNRALWHRSKQEIVPNAAPMYGDLVGRWLAAKRGRSYKCLVLDLDNTLWGGVVGDDGVEGLELGQGSPLGEAYVAFQSFVRDLSKRGVIIAVCSKNDEANALEPFDKHPDMVLRREDIACFVANWSNKADNIRAIAAMLNIGLDSLVFVDDNPFERNLVRQELPMVAVPEVGDDPSDYPMSIADAGYFESLAVTAEDLIRTSQYQANAARESARTQVTDLPAYLRSLEMKLVCRPFDEVGRSRVVQLINKSNQFNLTTRRYTDEDVTAVMNDQQAFGLQLRLIDRFGDNGIIAIIIGRLKGTDVYIDTWLMSCRVLGRQVEETTLNIIAEQAAHLGARRLIGEYRPTAKNAMVKDHYPNLGFATEYRSDETGEGIFTLDLSTYNSTNTFITVTGD